MERPERLVLVGSSGPCLIVWLLVLWLIAVLSTITVIPPHPLHLGRGRKAWRIGGVPHKAGAGSCS